MSQPVPLEPPAREKAHAAFVVNGERYEIAFAPQETLLELLREDLALTGTKHGCELGECGTCTVLVDGVPILSCLALALSYADRRIGTVEGLARGSTLHPLQDAFAELGAAQCGYCTPGFLLAAKALLSDHPSPTHSLDTRSTRVASRALPMPPSASRSRWTTPTPHSAGERRWCGCT